MDKFPHDGELIQEDVMDKERGWGVPVLLLRWRYRICSECKNKFDIAEQGRFYKCGECA